MDVLAKTCGHYHDYPDRKFCDSGYFDVQIAGKALIVIHCDLDCPRRIALPMQLQQEEQETSPKKRGRKPKNV